MTKLPTRRAREIDSARNMASFALESISTARAAVESAIYAAPEEALKRLREAGRVLDLAIARYEALERKPRYTVSLWTILCCLIGFCTGLLFGLP